MHIRFVRTAPARTEAVRAYTAVAALELAWAQQAAVQVLAWAEQAAVQVLAWVEQAALQRLVLTDLAVLGLLAQFVRQLALAHRTLLARWALVLMLHVPLT